MIDPWSKRKNLYSVQLPKDVKKPKIKWRILPVLWRAFKKTCTVIGAFVLLSALFIYMSIPKNSEQKAASLPNQMVLFLEFGGGLGELPEPPSLADPFAGETATLKNFVDTLEHAKADPRIKGIYARIGGASYPVAHIQEMRQAIKDFKKSGKFAYVFSESYGDGGTMGSYYLASVFDEIWMQPMGIVALPGIRAEMPFVRSVLDKVGVEPQFYKRKDYKTAYENMTDKEMSSFNREMIGDLISDIATTMEAEITEDIPSLKGKFKAHVDHALFTSPEAKKEGLVTHLDYEDVLLEKIRKEVTGNPQSDEDFYVDFSTYFQSFSAPKQSLADALIALEKQNEKKPVIASAATGKKKIALVYAVGAIMPSQTNAAAPVGMFEDGIAAADEISAALEEAALDDDVKIVVLRVDSPGGSPVASETILRAVERIQAKGKKVIVSMGPTAASGGYWISAYADRIFVMPLTITGSIGVLGGKFSADQLWKNLGVNWDGVSWGKNAGMFSMNTPFSESQAERINAMLDDVYVNFLARVAKGRRMTTEQVDKIAGGHVWSGQRAIKIGLADEIGSLNDALNYAAREIGYKNKSEAEVEILPRPQTPLEQFLDLLSGQVKAGDFSAAMETFWSMARPVAFQMTIAQKPQYFSIYNQIKVE